MDVVVVLLRIIHIGTGAMWVGAVVAFLLFVAPSTQVLEPPTRKRFLDELMGRRGYPRFIAVISTLTVLAGAVLYWRASGGLNAAWIASPTGLGFTVGALAAIVAWLLGPLGIKPTIDALDRLGSELLAAGRPPTADETARMDALGSRMQTLGRIDLTMLTIAVLGMAAALPRLDARSECREG